MKKTINLVIILLSVIAVQLAGGQVQAEQDTAASTIFHSDFVILKNPDGAHLEVGVNRRWTKETDKEGNDGSYYQGGIALGVNPSYTQIGASAEWMPKSFAVLRLQYDYYVYSGNNGFLTSFPSGDAAFGDTELEDREGEEEYGTGQRIMFKPTLRGKIGRLLIINEASFSYFLIRGDGPYFREGQYDTLVREDGDWVIDDLLILPVEIYKKGTDASLYAGPFYNITHARSADLTRQRVGLAAYWIPYDTLWRLDRPRAYAMLGYNLQDRNRDDEGFFIVGLGFDIEK